MRKTQCDLSFDHAQLDFNAMKNVARIAVGGLLETISKHERDIRDACLKDYATGIRLEAEYLAQAANRLEVCAEVLSTLIGAESRSELEIVNKPEITEN